MGTPWVPSYTSCTGQTRDLNVWFTFRVLSSVSTRPLRVSLTTESCTSPPSIQSFLPRYNSNVNETFTTGFVILRVYKDCSSTGGQVWSLRSSRFGFCVRVSFHTRFETPLGRRSRISKPNSCLIRS